MKPIHAARYAFENGERDTALRIVIDYLDSQSPPEREAAEGGDEVDTAMRVVEEWEDENDAELQHEDRNFLIAKIAGALQDAAKRKPSPPAPPAPEAKCPSCDGIGTESGFGDVTKGEPPCKSCKGTGQAEGTGAEGDAGRLYRELVRREDESGNELFVMHWENLEPKGREFWVRFFSKAESRGAERGRREERERASALILNLETMLDDQRARASDAESKLFAVEAERDELRRKVEVWEPVVSAALIWAMGDDMKRHYDLEDAIAALPADFRPATPEAGGEGTT